MGRYNSSYTLRDMENSIYPERAEFAFGRRGRDKTKRRKRMLQIAAGVGGAAALAGGLYAGSRTKAGQNLIKEAGYKINQAKAGVRSGFDRVRYGKKVTGPIDTRPHPLSVAQNSTDWKPMRKKLPRTPRVIELE